MASPGCAPGGTTAGGEVAMPMASMEDRMKHSASVRKTRESISVGQLWWDQGWRQCCLKFSLHEAGRTQRLRWLSGIWPRAESSRCRICRPIAIRDTRKMPLRPESFAERKPSKHNPFSRLFLFTFRRRMGPSAKVFAALAGVTVFAFQLFFEWQLCWCFISVQFVCRGPLRLGDLCNTIAWN